MYLIDSNIIIYYADKKYPCLDAVFEQDVIYVSEITRLEVLGYHNIGNLKPAFELLFNGFNSIPLNKVVIDKAILIRQQKKMSLGDSIIAATALLNGLIVVTRNTEDFIWLENIAVYNPFED